MDERCEHAGVKKIAFSGQLVLKSILMLSRSVTSCAGMTAYMVVVAQTKVGFLTGGRGEKFRSLPT